MVETISAELTVTNGAELAHCEKAWNALHNEAAYGDLARPRIASTG
ncbi:hypothetical protein [Nocardia niwae]